MSVHKERTDCIKAGLSQKENKRHGQYYIALDGRRLQIYSDEYVTPVLLRSFVTPKGVYFFSCGKSQDERVVFVLAPPCGALPSVCVEVPSTL